jgi:hypothetical protein
MPSAANPTLTSGSTRLDEEGFLFARGTDHKRLSTRRDFALPVFGPADPVGSTERQRHWHNRQFMMLIATQVCILRSSV